MRASRTSGSEAEEEQSLMVREELIRLLKRASVMVEDPPIPFSPFTLVDCMLLSHFSVNDFVAVAFPDLADDLDIQI